MFSALKVTGSVESDIASFNKYGVLIVANNKSEDKTLGQQVIRSLLEEYIAVADTKGGLGLRKENGFRELVQKDIGRYDLNLDHLLPMNEKKLNRQLSPLEVSTRQLAAEVENTIRPYLNEILTDQYIINGFGAVISKPGTEPQRWHVDSSHLFYPSAGILPCHFVTVFCPLFEYSEAIGPTEIALGSKIYTDILQNKTIENQYPTDVEVQSIINKPDVQIVRNESNMGDIGIMDGRTLHRGMGNNSDQVRPLLYMSFCRPWYYEFPRSQNENKSLFS